MFMIKMYIFSSHVLFILYDLAMLCQYQPDKYTLLMGIVLDLICSRFNKLPTNPTVYAAANLVILTSVLIIACLSFH